MQQTIPAALPRHSLASRLFLLLAVASTFAALPACEFSPEGVSGSDDPMLDDAGPDAPLLGDGGPGEAGSPEDTPDAMMSAPGEACDNPFQLGTMSAVSSLSRSLSMTGRGDEGTPSCGQPGRSDLVYRVLFSGSNSVSVTVSPSGGWSPALAIYRNSCGVPGAEIRCLWNNSARSETASFVPESGAVYYIWIDMRNDDSGSLSLGVDRH